MSSGSTEHAYRYLPGGKGAAQAQWLRTNRTIDVELPNSWIKSETELCKPIPVAALAKAPAVKAPAAKAQAAKAPAKGGRQEEESVPQAVECSCCQ